jgi:hypothetical protein
LVRSIICTRRKNIGTAAEFVNEDPALAEFFLSRPELEVNKDDSMVDKVTAMNVIPDMLDQGELHTVPEEQNEDSREDVDPREALPPQEADNEPPVSSVAGRQRVGLVHVVFQLMLLSCIRVYLCLVQNVKSLLLKSFAISVCF